MNTHANSVTWGYVVLPYTTSWQIVFTTRTKFEEEVIVRSFLWDIMCLSFEKPHDILTLKQHHESVMHAMSIKFEVSKTHFSTVIK